MKMYCENQCKAIKGKEGGKGGKKEEEGINDQRERKKIGLQTVG